MRLRAPWPRIRETARSTGARATSAPARTSASVRAPEINPPG
jgi:hypothetical protein